MMNFYGDNLRWFLGTVVDINDPFEMGRVRVRIHGLHTDNTDDIPTSDIPFAHVVADIRQGGVSGIGSNIGIKENAQVFGIFLDGKNSQVPLVLGSLTKIENTPSYEIRQLVEENADEIARLKDLSNKQADRINDLERQLTTSDNETFKTADMNIEKAFLFLKSSMGGDIGDERNSGAIASGIVGNLMAESGQPKGERDAVDQISADPTRKKVVRTRFDIYPDAMNPTKEKSLGIAQWNPGTDRVRNLIKFSAERNISPLTLTAQLMFIKHELFKVKIFGRMNLMKVGPGIEGAEKAAIEFEDKYERSADGAEGINKRKKFAREVFNKFEDNQ